jgi:hypothetical protein
VPPNNQSPLSGLFNLFRGSGSQTPPSYPGRSGGFPGLGGNPGRAGGFPGLGGNPGSSSGGGGFLGFGGGGSSKGGGLFPGLGGSSKSGGMFGLGDILKNLGKMDISKVMDGINNFRSMMSNAQKVVQTLNQLGITVGNIQKIMKQVDLNALMGLLQGGDSSSDASTQQDAPGEGNTGNPDVDAAPPKRKKRRTATTKKKGRTRKKSTSAKGGGRSGTKKSARSRA